jgi:hypothetical protein
MKRLGVLIALLLLAVPAVAWQVSSTSPPSPQLVPSIPAPSEPKVTTVEALISKLADIQAKKAALEKAEKETVTQIKEKLKQQKERLKKLGVNVESGTPPPPPPSLSTRG